MPKPKLKRFIPYNIYGAKGRTILARNLNAAINKAPKNANKVLSEAHLIRKFGKVPKEIL